MFNLLVKADLWADGRDAMPLGRVFEYTNQMLADRLRAEGRLDLEALSKLPALFMHETGVGDPDRQGRVGTIIRAEQGRGEVMLEYAYNLEIPPLSNGILREMAVQLAIEDFEFTRVHWAVKQADLYKALMRQFQPRRPRPNVFQLQRIETVDPRLVSVMMPFTRAFDPVYQTLQNAAGAAGLRCQRADDIWENPAIIQDIVSLIDRSRTVICDCTGRNANVFYEAGIAHTLGRDVIFITQNAADIPFDVHHLRYISYLDNREGLHQLHERLLPRLAELAR